MLTSFNISTETLEPTDDIEKNARMKKRIQDQLAKLKRNAERRRQRQLNKNASLAENPVFGLMRGKKEGAIVSRPYTIQHIQAYPNLHLLAPIFSVNVVIAVSSAT